jgi:uncharacterized protein with von Willebrand factor type A (vWA) domain
VIQDQEIFFWELFKRLREWHFPLAPEDYQSLHDALSAGFGWKSLADLRSLCSALWAKSRQDQEILYSIFDRLVKDFGWENWRLIQDSATTGEQNPVRVDVASVSEVHSAHTEDGETRSQQSQTRQLTKEPELRPQEEVAGISLIGLLRILDTYSHSHLIFNPRYVLSYRQVAQAWRRLRRLVRRGPKTELDVQGTIDLRCRQGVVSAVVLRARKRNAVRLLLLLDRQGSMVPFHHFSDNAIQAAIYQSGRFEQAETFYFHDVPRGRRSTKQIQQLRRFSEHLFPQIDKEVGNIHPLNRGYVYKDPQLLKARLLTDVLADPVTNMAVVIVSDAGAARGDYDTARLVDSVAFLKTLYAHTLGVVWLNPLSEHRWQHSTAAQIARFVPMFPVNHEGLNKAVNVLRGQAFDLEYPL